MAKVTEEQIKGRISDVSYSVLPNTTITVCVITLTNGFKVTGESACVDPTGFKKDLGEAYAYEKAFNKIWELEGYLLKERMFHQSDFGTALRMLREGYKVARDGWNGKGLWLEMQVPDEGSKMTLPYIYTNYPVDSKNTPGARVPWLVSQTDMLAFDWVLVP